jgi:ADP-dependent phosphofructokinase/glucokinase
MWTVDNELPGNELACKYPDVVRLDEVFDRRNSAGDDTSVHYVFEYCKGSQLRKYLETLKANENKYLEKGHFLDWAI